MLVSTKPASRRAAVAGVFYPGDPDALRITVRTLLDDAAHNAAATASTNATAPIKALIAPHAGYVYSGPVAAHAYAQLAPHAGRVRRVVLLGPAHRVPVRGLALPGVARFDTPLGSVPVDDAAVAALRSLPQVVESPRAHAAEHALEVQLPFLQQVLGEFTLVPLVVGDTSADEVAEVLERVWGGEETLVVISSDLSHYLPYALAQATDRATVDAMLACDTALDPHQACGAVPINGLLTVARRKHLAIELLDLRNSGDTAGDRSRVVGYAALALRAPAAAEMRHDTRHDIHSEATQASALGHALLAQARAAIAQHLGVPAPAAPDLPSLHEHGATFVTLKVDGELRGCIGTLQACRSLHDDVRANAVAAAFSDARFAPLRAEELPRLRVEVSLLSPSAPMTVEDEADLCRQLRPGLDGLTLTCGPRRATFLPQVWDNLPVPRAFVAALKHKMGLPTDFWSREMRAERYTVHKWREAEAL